MLGLAGLAQRKHRRMLDHPHFVCGGLITRIGETLHRTPHRRVRLLAEIAQLRRQDGHSAFHCLDRYSVHFTSG